MGKNSPQAETPLIIFKARLKAFLPIIHSTLIKVEILIKIFLFFNRNNDIQNFWAVIKFEICFITSSKAIKINLI